MEQKNQVLLIKLHAVHSDILLEKGEVAVLKHQQVLTCLPLNVSIMVKY